MERNRLFRLTGLLAAGALALSACGGTAATPTTVTSEPTATTAASGTQGTPATSGGGLTGKIDFQVFGDPAELAAFQSVVDGFRTAQPDATVNVIHVPAQGDHMTKLSAAFASGSPPDVFIINYRRYGQLASKGVIEPAGPLMQKSGVLQESDYYPQSLDAFRYQGTLMCVPQNISNLEVYYNKDLFAANNVAEPTADWTWDDFLAAAQAMTRDTNGDGTMDTHGLGVEPQLIRLAPFVWANGGDIVDNPDKPTKLTLDTPEAREALQWFVDLQRSYKVTPNEAEAKSEDVESRFMNGRIGMVLASRASTPSFREIEGFEWDVAPLPMKKEKSTILHSDAYCIASASKNKDLAWAFVEYAQGPDGQTRAAKLGRTVPSRKDIAQSEAFLDPTQAPASSQVFLDMIPHMQLVPIISTWPQVEGVVNEELERAFYGVITVDEAINLSIEQTNKLFADAETAK
jgi:multiple sugar transport system substrate-binding protein